jgi:hypothetical protein
MSDLAVSGFCGMVGRGSDGYGKGVQAKSSAMRLKMSHQIGGNQGRPGIGGKHPDRMGSLRSGACGERKRRIVDDCRIECGSGPGKIASKNLILDVPPD